MLAPPLLGQGCPFWRPHTAGEREQNTPASPRPGCNHWLKQKCVQKTSPKVSSESQARYRGKVRSECELLLDHLLLWTFKNISHFPLLVWIPERSQYLNISPQCWFGFCFLTIWRIQLLSWRMWAGKRGLFFVSPHLILMLYTQSFNVTAGIIIGRIMQESEFDNLGPRLQ